MTYGDVSGLRYWTREQLRKLKVPHVLVVDKEPRAVIVPYEWFMEAQAAIEAIKKLEDQSERSLNMTNQAELPCEHPNQKALTTDKWPLWCSDCGSIRYDQNHWREPEYLNRRPSPTPLRSALEAAQSAMERAKVQLEIYAPFCRNEAASQSLQWSQEQIAKALLLAQAALIQSPPPPDSRAEFEAWGREKMKWNMELLSNGHYLYNLIDGAWLGWQAARAGKERQP